MGGIGPAYHSVGRMDDARAWAAARCARPGRSSRPRRLTDAVATGPAAAAISVPLALLVLRGLISPQLTTVLYGFGVLALSDVVRYRIAIPAVANTFKAGHRIRVAVFNALDNYSFPNSNTGGDEARVTRTVVGNMRVHHEPEYPSHIVLPVLHGGTE